MKDNNELITIAIHTTEKAHILKQVLREKGIEAFLVNIEEGDNSSKEMTNVPVMVVPENSKFKDISAI